MCFYQWNKDYNKLQLQYYKKRPIMSEKKSWLSNMQM